MDQQVSRLKALLAMVSPYPLPEDLSEGDDLFNRGVLNSLGIVEFVVALEQEFAFRFDFKDLTRENFTSLGSIASYLKRTLG